MHAHIDYRLVNFSFFCQEDYSTQLPINHKTRLTWAKTQFYRPGNPYNQENFKQLYLSSISVTELSFLTTKVSKGQ